MSLRAVLGFSLTLFMSAATAFPDKPVKLIIPYSAGGLTDQIGRTLAKNLGEIWDQQVIVENKPGAGSTIGASYVARSEPDGHTLLLGSVGMVTNPLLMSEMSYDATDLAPLALQAVAPNVLFVHKDVPANDVDELVRYAKDNPGALTFASSGVASSPRLAAELFSAKAGIDIIHVPYKGTGAAITDLLSGEINAYFDTMQSMVYTE